MGCMLFRLKLENIICLIKICEVSLLSYPDKLKCRSVEMLALCLLCFESGCQQEGNLSMWGFFFLLSNKYQFILSLFNKMVTMHMIVHSCIVSGNLKRPTPWPSQ